MSQSKPSAPTSGVRTLRGSCPCKTVQYEFDFDPAQGSTRCNCTICRKTAWWGANIKPAAFRLLAGKESLGDYSKSEYGHARFCTKCGVRCFAHGFIPEMGGDYCGVNLNTVDGEDLTGIEVQYLDGLHDTWALMKVAPWVDPFAVSSPGAQAGNT